MANQALADVTAATNEVEKAQGSFANFSGDETPEFTGDHDYKGVAGSEIPGGK